MIPIHPIFGYLRFWKVATLLCGLALAMPALAGQPVVTKEDGKIEFSLEQGGCRLVLFGAARNAGKSSNPDDPGLFSMQEYCDVSVSTEAETPLLEQLFATVFSKGAFGSDNYVWFVRMSAMPFDCDLARYAAVSAEWPALLKKLGGKPVEYMEQTPDEVQAALGDFIRKGGLLNNLEKIFHAHGYRLKRVTIGHFRMVGIKDLDRPQWQCLALGGKPSARILPNEAELYLVFERVR